MEDELDLAVVEGEDAGGSAGTGAEVDEDLKFTLPATLKVSTSSFAPSLSLSLLFRRRFHLYTSFRLN